MKHIIILGDGMADHPVERLGGKTLLQYAHTPYMDMLAKPGKHRKTHYCTRRFSAWFRDSLQPLSMGYDQNEVFTKDVVHWKQPASATS